MLQVEIDSFSYGEKDILKKIKFTLERGEHLSVLGESGCGKSTLLHIIYGLLPLESGSIWYNHKKLLGPTHSLIPGEPFMKLVAQEFNIMPFSTVSENVSSHLQGFDRKKDRQRIADLLETVELVAFADTLVKNLSGGQKQRVALAKALANAPAILLLDEPFSNIDTFRKNKLSRKIFRYLKLHNISCITATHDSEEALTFSDKILILKEGKIQIYGSPEYVYQNASTPYEAGFFGEVNTLPDYLIKDDPSGEINLVFPRHLKIAAQETKLQVKVRHSYFKGDHYLIESLYGKEVVFFENPKKLVENSYVWLKHVPK